MTSQELRQKYLDFFGKKGHKVIPSAPLVPENDPSILFTTAGMHPLVPYLLGQSHPDGKRLVDVQKCLRTDDIDEVGDICHHTFFEMLGNWSLGDYFKEEAIKWSYEFLTSKEYLNLPKEKLGISVFQGDQDAPFDQESFDIWLKLGISEERIAKLPKKDNWWGPVGESGPCGPDTEMFIWTGPEEAPRVFDPTTKQWVEVWNNVFMQYNKTAEGKFELLSQKSVDTGMGLERALAVSNGLDDNYQTDLFLPIIQKIEEISNKKYAENFVGFRIIADHIRAATFILADKISPSNVGQGYILRKLIRRAIRYGKRLGVQEGFTSGIAEVVISLMGDIYPELKNNKSIINNSLNIEEKKFQKALEEGLKKAQKIFGLKIPLNQDQYSQLMQTKNKNDVLKKFYEGQELDLVSKLGTAANEVKNATISGKESFDLFQTAGFPIEMILELAQEKNLLVDVAGYKAELRKHQELSRTASAGMFKGGLGEQSEVTTKYHTATHLLHAALRQVLGTHVQQKGSNITAERLRFDFSHSEKISEEQLKQVEAIVNQVIKDNLPVTSEVMDKEEALKSGALGFFTEKYGDKVTVYTIGNFSREICGGPHVQNTGDVGKFTITKEESAGSGVRRIYATLTN